MWLVGAIALALTFAQSPGRISPDTKLDLTANPLRFLARATNLWNSELPFGQAQNQAYGYLFPHGTFFLIGHALGVPGWITQRLWWALLLTVGFWGLLRVAEALGIGSPGSRVIAAAAFALSPRVLTTLGSISSETLPMMLAPWVLLPTILALRATGPRSVRALAAQAGVAVALMGAVNAIATVAGCLPAVIWWACHRPNRLWWRYTGWWLVALVLATLWWVVGLVMLRAISPPFLDFIESSGVTTQWSSLVEMLRGTDSWTPYVAPTATAGAPLVTGSAAVLGTCLVAAAGLAGLAGPTMPARGRLVTMLLIGVVLMAAGYSGGLGSPAAHAVQAFLDAGGAPLRNVHKLGSVIRIPIVLGVAQLLGRIPLPGSAPKSLWLSAFAHPERDKRVATAVVVLTALMVSTSLAWTGRLTPPGTFTAIPPYWQQTADWLTQHNTGSPTPGRVLVAPGAPFATQVWGTSHDEPLQVLGASPWGVRDSIPLTPPQTIRALDSVQRLFAAGRPSLGLADTLARQGISYVVVRNDLDPDTSRSARPILVHRAVDGSPGLHKVAQFGAPVGPGTVAGFVADSGLRPRYPAVEVYRVDAGGDAGTPYFVDTDRMARIDGGPEVLLRLDERRRLLGQPPLGPALLTADARAAGLPLPAGPASPSPTPRWPARRITAGWTNIRRRSGPRRRAAHLQPGARLPGPRRRSGARRVDGRANHGVELGLGFHRDARRRAGHLPGRRDRRGPGDGVGVQLAAIGRRAMDADRFRPPGDQCGAHLDPQRHRRRRPGPPHSHRNRNGQHHFAVRPAGQAARRGAALRRDPVAADHRRRHRRRIARGAVRHHRLDRHPVRRVRLRAPGRPAAYRAGARAAAGVADHAVGVGTRAARPARLRPGARQCALRAVDGAGPGRAGHLQPDADGAGADVGHPDGVGAPPPGTQAGRPDHRTEYDCGSRRFGHRRRSRLGVCGHRRRPGHRLDRAATGGAAQDAAHPDAHPAPAHPGRRGAPGSQPGGAARPPHHGGRQPGRRPAGDRGETRSGADDSAQTPGDRHGDHQPAGLGRRHRPQRVGLRPAQAARAGRGRGAGRRRQPDRPRRRRPQPRPRGQRRLRTRAGHRRRGPVRTHRDPHHRRRPAR
ncbi:hypothetical protein I549_0990 [Mycobacterium avium subsp. avium 2285 (R)]|nr:hypothetical protein I549_0990 [Mycobacterium avium subsp. avium 2285 (R)]